MKSLFFILTIFASILPYTAKAETPKMSEKAIQEAVDKYGAIYCTEGLDALKVAVKKCYEDTPEASPEIDKCILIDFTMAAIAIRKNQRYESLNGVGLNDPETSDPYMSSKLVTSRKNYYETGPRFTKDPQLSKMDEWARLNYFPNFGSLPKLFTKRCPDPKTFY